MVLFSGSLMISDLGYQETEEELLSRFNEMGIWL
jgi:gamma-glutamylcysteine synthetase